MLAVGENLLRADSDILEVFDYRWDASFRVPLTWLGLNPVPRRNQLMLRIGTAIPVGPVLYGPDVRWSAATASSSPRGPMSPPFAPSSARLPATSAGSCSPDRPGGTRRTVTAADAGRAGLS